MQHIIGSLGAGAAANKATDKVFGAFIEDDADEMVRIIEKQFSELAVDYLLAQIEAEKIVDNLRERLAGKVLKDMYSSKDRQEFARNLLVPLIETEVSKRKRIALPTTEQINGSLREVLEEISDSMTMATA